MRNCAVLVALLVFSSVSSSLPSIVRGPSGSGVVEYPRGNGPLEAWEIVTDWVDGTYLNYSRAFWGDLGAPGRPVVVCATKTEDKKFAGIGFNEAMLKDALTVVIQDKLGLSADTSTDCALYSDLIARNHDFSDLQKFYDSL